MDTQKITKEQFTANVLEGLKNKSLKWVRGWDINEALGTMPINGSTNKAYTGWNAWNLAMAGNADNRYMTFNQAKALGLKIKKGAKGSAIFRPVGKKVTVENPVTGEKEEKFVFLRSFKQHWVFNAKDIEGIKTPELKVKNEWEINELAEKILKNSGAVINYGGNSAFYKPSTDEINLPVREAFKSDADFYGTAIHELVHWTGAKNRLNRNQEGSYGSESYAFEELVAELASWLISAVTGLPFDATNHQAYINSWYNRIKADSNVLFDAINMAEKAKDMVLGFLK